MTHWAWKWVARLRDDLEKVGYPTFFETFPDSIEARSSHWLPFLNGHIRAGEDDVLVGWSCGGTAALRYAQEHKVRGLVLAAPYYTDLGLDSVRKSGFVTSPWDWERVKRNAGNVVMFHSDNDPYISQSEFRELARLLGARRCEIRGAGHFGDFEEFPQLTNYILGTYP